MIFKWLDASEAEKFGQALAQLFISKVPVVVKYEKNKNVAKQLDVADQMYARIDQFKRENKLNIYKKAALGRAFKFELINAGYKPELIDQLTKGVMLKL